MRAAGAYQGYLSICSYVSRSPDKRGTRVIRGGCLSLLFPDDVAAPLIRATSELDAKAVGYLSICSYVSRSPDKRGTRVIRGGCLSLLFPDDVAAQLIRATYELDAKTVAYTDWSGRTA